MRIAKTKHNFRLKIFLRYTKIAFENNAFPKIKIILGNFKFVILDKFRLNFRKILGIFENRATGGVKMILDSSLEASCIILVIALRVGLWNTSLTAFFCKIL